jgi:Importin repeat
VKKDDERDEHSTLRLSALEFMISLSEATPNMVRKVEGWTDIIICACLEGMGEFDEDETQMSGLVKRRREYPSYHFLYLSYRLMSVESILQPSPIRVQQRRTMNNLWIGLPVRLVGGLCCPPRSKYTKHQ